MLYWVDKNLQKLKKILATKPLVCYDTKGYFHSHVTINTHMDVKAGANLR